jgi:hypothetical protein
MLSPINTLQPRAKQRLRAGLALECLGQHIEQGRGQQHPGREAHQVVHHAAQHPHGEAGCDQHRQQAAGQRRHDDVEKRHGLSVTKKPRVARLGEGNRGILGCDALHGSRGSAALKAALFG